MTAQPYPHDDYDHDDYDDYDDSDLTNEEADERWRQEILADARPLPPDWGIHDLTDDERDAFLATIAEG